MGGRAEEGLARRDVQRDTTVCPSEPARPASTAPHGRKTKASSLRTIYMHEVTQITSYILILVVAIPAGALGRRWPEDVELEPGRHAETDGRSWRSLPNLSFTPGV